MPLFFGPAGPAARPAAPVASHTHNYYNGDAPLSNGTDTGSTFRYQHTARGASYGPQLVFGNYYLTGPTPGMSAGPNDLTVRASIEVPSGTFYPVFFAGARDVVVKPGATVTSDPLGVELSDGTTFYTRTYVSVSAGGKWPLGLITVAANGEGNNRSASPSDLTTSGTVATVNEHGYSPLAILGRTLAPQRSVAIVGDSIAAGQADTSFGREPGFIVRALDAAGIPYVHLTLPGEYANGFAPLAGREPRMRLVRGCTSAIVNYGTNDLNGGRTVAQVQADLGTIWAALAARGLKVYQCTICPRTTSTDSWATLGNQTQNTYKANYAALNDWIRTRPSPLSGYFEVADVVESARNSGLWNVAPALTPDGVHPNATGHANAAAAILTSQLV